MMTVHEKFFMPSIKFQTKSNKLRASEIAGEQTHCCSPIEFFVYM